ncbi:MAG: hypothetical protein ACSLFJ_10385, partial [Immundisolibacter sp.]|uniref:hypothetical protein n=1 Tax=Immundisolibacter sp. TaxID=1934948 RepID=UPI003EE35F8E
ADPDVPFSPKLLRRILSDPQPFPYYIFMWGWHSLIGVSEPASRIVGGGVLAGSLVVTVRVLKGVLPVRMIVLVVAMLSFSWAGIQFSHEARSYAFLYGFACIGYALLLRSLVLGPTRRVTYGMFFVAMAAGASHYYGMVFGSALFIGRAIGLWRAGRNMEARGDVYRLLFLTAFYCTLLLPQLSHLADRAGGEFWVKNDPLGLIKSYAALFFFGYSGKIGLGLLVVGAALGVRRSSLIAPVLIAVAVSFLVPALISLHTPILLARYLVITVPPLLIVLALGCGLARTRLAAILGAVAAVLFFVDAWHGYFNLEKKSWSSSAALVAAEAGKGCVVPVWSWQPAAYSFYLPEYLRASLVRVRPDGPVPSVPASCRVVLWAAAADGLRLAPPADVLVVKHTGAQVWLRRGVSR